MIRKRPRRVNLGQLISKKLLSKESSRNVKVFIVIFKYDQIINIDANYFNLFTNGLFLIFFYYFHDRHPEHIFVTKKTIFYISLNKAHHLKKSSLKNGYLSRAHIKLKGKVARLSAHRTTRRIFGKPLILKIKPTEARLDVSVGRHRW